MTQTQNIQARSTSPRSGPQAGTEQQARHRLRVARRLLGRDSATFARRWPGKVLIALILVAIPLFMLFRSLRADRYTDTSWQAVLMTAALVVTYLATRRVLVTVTVGVLPSPQ